MVKIQVGLMGSSPMGGSVGLSTAENVTGFLDTLQQYGVKEIDTARIYSNGRSEELLGEVKASSRFVVSTKAPGFSPGTLQYDKIITNCNASLAALKQDKVDIYYIHGPDRETPFEEQARAFNTLYKEGKFERFGVCNITADEVQQIYDICKRNGWVLPTVYQGGYNILARTSETDLFPKLRSLGMSFVGFGPLAHGLLVKKIEDIMNPEKGSHFAELPFLAGRYLQEKNLAALKAYTATCEQAGLTRMEVALRWQLHHSPLGDQDSILIGASSKEQVAVSLKAASGGPLPENLVQAVQKLWDDIKDTAGPNTV